MTALEGKTDRNEEYAMKVVDQNEFTQQNLFGLGKENTAYARYFSGQSLKNHFYHFLMLVQSISILIMNLFKKIKM